jgi:hypothetical protein
MSDILWRRWADAWDAWDVWAAADRDRSGRDDFWGYDRWKSDIGPWPSVRDDPRPTRLHPAARAKRRLDAPRA